MDTGVDAVDFNAFLHVKGKSGMKHTLETLRCWRARPELPMLTVVGECAFRIALLTERCRGRIYHFKDVLEHPLCGGFNPLTEPHTPVSAESEHKFLLAA